MKLILATAIAFLMVLPNIWSNAAPAHSAAGNSTQQKPAQTVTVQPRPFAGGLRNPMMGFIVDLNDGIEAHPWVTLARHYIKWNEIENSESDSVEKIRAFCDEKWRNVAQHNIKVVPRVYLRWAREDQSYWPADMKSGDFSSPQFVARLQRLIARLGQVWDNDPRVASIQMGLIGLWGEHHTPSLTPEMQKIMGDAFTAAFKSKKVTVRHPWDFTGYRFGIYWDSWAHADQMATHGEGIFKLGNRWKTQVIGGETAYDWGNYKTQPGLNPTDTVKTAVHRNFLINSIRRLHGNYIGWVAAYDRQDDAAVAGAAQVQAALGYRLVIPEATLPSQLRAAQDFDVTLTIRNDGSTPFYADWPLEVSLLDVKTRQPVWKNTFAGVSTSNWLPGDNWDEATQSYRVAPLKHRVSGRFRLPAHIAQGEYYLAVALLDPDGNLPAARFAIANYFDGGRQPLARVGVGVAAHDSTLRTQPFDDPNADRTLHYLVKTWAPQRTSDKTTLLKKAP
jgi:hypothetical protein